MGSHSRRERAYGVGLWMILLHCMMHGTSQGRDIRDASCNYLPVFSLLLLLDIRLHIPALCSPSALVVALDTLDTLSATSQRALVRVVVL